MLLSPWDFPGQSTGMGCHFLLQGIFPTQGSNWGVPHCRQMLLPSEPIISSVQFSCSIMSDSLRPLDYSTPGLHVHLQLPELESNSCPSSWLCHLTILCHRVLLLPSVFPSFRVFSNESLLCIRWPDIGVLASASVLPMTIQD